MNVVMDTNQLKQGFFERYGSPEQEPELFFAPGRVNLIGEHTDYNGGFVFPCALQYGTYLLIRKRADGMLRFASVNQEFAADIPPDKANQKIAGSWVNYPLGVFDQFRQKGIALQGFEMLFSGDIPNSAGLSSSASIEMVIAYALNEMLGAGMMVLDLVKLSQKAENEFVGVNCGIMDQFAVGMGEKDHAIFLNCLTLENKLVPLVLNGYKLVIGNTNKQRGLADSKYNERVTECQLAVTYLGDHFNISKLGAISFMQFFKVQDIIPDEVIRKRARHVISENQRVLNAVSALWKGDIVQFGALMNASHESLRDNYEVTGAELDAMVEEAWKINGVVGSRMTGAGFGGCTVSIVRDDAVERFLNEVGSKYFARTKLTPEFYIAEVSRGVYKI
jgi:galactokinase